MKKFMRVLTALVLSLVVAFAFVGCNDPKPQDSETQTFGTMASKTVENLFKLENGFTVTATLTDELLTEDNVATVTIKLKPVKVSGEIVGYEMDMRMTAGETLISGTIITGGKEYIYDFDNSVWTLPEPGITTSLDVTADMAQMLAVFDELPITVKNTASGHTATVNVDMKQMFTDYKTTINNYKEVAFKDFVLELRYGKNSGKTTADLQTELEAMFGAETSVKSFVEDYADKYVAALFGAGNSVKTLVNKMSGYFGLTAQSIYDMIKAQDPQSTVAAPTAGQSVYDYVMGIVGQQKAKDVFDMLMQIISNSGNGGAMAADDPEQDQGLQFTDIPAIVMQWVNATKGDIEAEGTATDPATVADMYDFAIGMLSVEMPMLNMLTTDGLAKITVTTGVATATVETDAAFNFKSLNASYDIDVSYQETAESDPVTVVKQKKSIAVSVDTTTAVTITAPQITPAA